MIVFNDKPTVFFDVDNTLVFSESEAPAECDTFIQIQGRDFWVHDLHVEAIKDFYARGHNIVVWSAGGAEWAADIVYYLGLAQYVTACIEKPRWYFDDKKVEQWMPEVNRTYLPVRSANA